MDREGALHGDYEDLEYQDEKTTSSGDPVVLSRDALLHGDGDDEDEDDTQSPIVTDPPKPTPRRSILGKFKTAVVSALGRHDTTVTARNAFGKEVTRTLKSRDVFEIEQETFAKLRATESKDKWDPKSVEGLNGWQRFGKGVERFFDRTWRSMATEKVHLAKEKQHGMKLSATVGIEGAISEEFNTTLDQAARNRLTHERNTGWKRFTGGTKDFFQEFIGHERDLHKYKLAEAERLASEYRNNPADTNHPLYQLINRDTATREEFAARINESPLELLHETNNKDKKVEGIVLEGEHGTKVDKFLKEEIIAKAMDDVISQNEQTGDRSGKINANLRRELDQSLQDYFFGDEFQAWRNSLTPEQQQSFENSFTVASDVLLQFEEGMAPAILDNLDHYKGTERLDFEIELALGTAQLSAHSESMGGTHRERTKDRASLNEKLWNKLQDKDPYSPEAIKQGLKREKLLSAAHAIFINEATAALAGAVAGRGLATTARAGLSWLPVVGSAGVAGTMAGFKEWARHGEMRSTYGMGRAEGLEFPEANNAIRSAEMRASDYHRLEFSHRTQQFLKANDKLNSGDFDNNTILLTMAEISDSGARLKLSNERDINLLVAGVDGPEGRGIRNRELRIHDQARAITTAKVRELLSDQTRLNEIATEMGYTVPAGTTPEEAVDQMFDLLQTAQYNSLLGATTVAPEVTTMIGNLSPDLVYNQQESIRTRDKIYNGLRWKSTGKRAATSATVAGLMSWGMGHWSESHQQVTETGTEHQLIPVIDHNLPQHVDPLTTGDIHNPETGDILATMHAHVPAGTHLEEISARVGGPDDLDTHYNLVTDYLNADGTHDTLVRDMDFGPDGQLNMTVEVRDALAHNHLNVNHTPLAEVGWGGHEAVTTTEIDTSQFTHTLAYKDFPDQDIDGYFAKNIHDSFAQHPESIPGGATAIDRVTYINGLRFFMRSFNNNVTHQENIHLTPLEGYDRTIKFGDSMWGSEFLVKGQSDTAVITGLPEIFVSPEGNRQVVDLINEAIHQHNAGLDFSDEAHRIAYEMSYEGTEDKVPDASELRTLLEYFNQLTSTTEPATNAFSATPHDVWFTMAEDLTKVAEVPIPEVFTQTVPGWTSWLATSVGYSRPLEAPLSHEKIQPIPYELNYYGQGGLDENRKKLFKEMRSPRLIENPSAVLDEKEEIESYLNKLDSNYRHEIETLHDQLGQPSPNTKLTILIPVADHQEEKNIATTIENYSHQTRDPKDYEIILYLNHPETDQKGNPINQDNTENEIRRIMQKHPNLPIKIMKQTIPIGKAKIGYVRKVLADTALLRQQIRHQSAPPNTQISPMIMVSNDGDNLGIAPKYINNYIERFASNPEADAMLGQLDWDPEAYSKYPLIHVGTRLFQYLSIRGRRNSGHMPSSGANFAYKSNIYAAIGGYLADLPGGEDIAIGQAILEARQDTDRIQYAGAINSRIYTSARRAVDALKHGLAPIEQWNRGFSAFDNEIRRFELGEEKEINYDNPEEQVKLKEGLEHIIDRTLDTYEAGEKLGKDAHYYRQALSHLGIEYFVKDNKVMITNIDTLLKGLKHYQEIGTLMKKLKTGTITDEEKLELAGIDH